MLLRIFGVTVMSLVITGCQPSAGVSSVPLTDSADIIGGRPVDPELEPRISNSTVALVSLFGSTYSAFCSGTLISKDLVLTAAHCVRAAQMDEFYVSVGHVLPSLETADSLIRVSDSMVNEAYVGEPISRYNDIAVLKLERAVENGSTPMSLATKADPLPQSLQATTAGFGLTEESPRKFATEANLASIRIDTSQRELYSGDQHSGVGACGGDSGGAVIYSSQAGDILIAETRGESPYAKGCSGVGEYTPVGIFEGFIRESSIRLNAQLPNFVTIPKAP